MHADPLPIPDQPGGMLHPATVLTEKLARRGHHLVREYSVDPFDVHRVGEVLDGEPARAPVSCAPACGYEEENLRERGALREAGRAPAA